MRIALARVGAVTLGLPLALVTGLAPGAIALPAEAPGATGSAAAVSAPPPGVKRVTLLSYNIKDGAYRGRTLPSVAREIRSSGADIVVLNEIDSRAGDTPQPQWLAEQLGMTAVFYPNHTFRGVKSRGNAILSRYPVVKSRNTLLTYAKGTEQRGLIRAKIDLGDGLTIRVAGTHLQNRSYVKLVQARQISALLGQPTCATFLLGDMNAWPLSPELNALTAYFRDPVASGRFGEGKTNPSHRPRGRIDYVLVAHRAFAQESVVMPRWSSDHLAVRTTFNVRPRATCDPRIPRS